VVVVAQTISSGIGARREREQLSRREQLVIIEIEQDMIDTASGFVDYICQSYGISKSSVWYILNRLKGRGLVEFADREHIGEPLRLTKDGIQALYSVGQERQGIIKEFSERAEVGWSVAGQRAMYGNRGIAYPAF
jgi:Mn-dependent DtxR family transcriptional regulator